MFFFFGENSAKMTFDNVKSFTAYLLIRVPTVPFSKGTLVLVSGESCDRVSCGLNPGRAGLQILTGGPDGALHWSLNNTANSFFF